VFCKDSNRKSDALVLIHQLHDNFSLQLEQTVFDLPSVERAHNVPIYESTANSPSTRLVRMLCIRVVQVDEKRNRFWCKPGTASVKK